MTRHTARRILADMSLQTRITNGPAPREPWRPGGPAVITPEPRQAEWLRRSAEGKLTARIEQRRYER